MTSRLPGSANCGGDDHDWDGERRETGCEGKQQNAKKRRACDTEHDEPR